MEKHIKGTTRKSSKQKDKKRGSSKPFRKKSFKYVVSKIFKSLGVWAHRGHPGGLLDAEDEDGGFKTGKPCTNSVSVKDEDRMSLVRTCTLQSRSSVKDRLSLAFGDKTPGVLGLKNHGNTCFMNAVVQCLSNTDLLAEYLALERYKLDISESPAQNPVRNEEAPGEVTEQLAALVRALWTLESSIAF